MTASVDQNNAKLIVLFVCSNMPVVIARVQDEYYERRSSSQISRVLPLFKEHTTGGNGGAEFIPGR